MIITAGKLKGQKVLCPKGKDVRPTSSKTRMGIFNVISSNYNFENQINILELFAGTGLFSFEALSRDADKATLVDKSETSVSFIRNNIKNLKLTEIAEVIKMDAIDFIKGNDLSSYNLVFMDPPYALDLNSQILQILSTKLLPNTAVMIETNKEFIKEDSDIKDYKILRVKNWGEAIVTFLIKI